MLTPQVVVVSRRRNVQIAGFQVDAVQHRRCGTCHDVPDTVFVQDAEQGSGVRGLTLHGPLPSAIPKPFSTTGS